MTLPVEARNEVLFIIVGFADHPVSNFPRSQPLIFTGKSYANENKFRKFEELVFCDLWFPVSGFRIPVSYSRFWFPFPDSGFLVLGLPMNNTV